MRGGAAPGHWLRNARTPVCVTEAGGPLPAADDLAHVDIRLAGGVIAEVAPHDPARPLGEGERDLGRGIVFPAFADMHTHLDKGHIWPRAANPDGTFAGALEAVRADREANWRAGDVRRRMDFALRTAFAHGTALIRTHLDSIPPQDDVSWPVFAEMRAEWAGRIELQAVSLMTVDDLPEGRALDAFAAKIAGWGGIIGGVVYASPARDAALDRLFAAAGRHGLDVDLHVDETLDPAADGLDAVLDAIARTGFDGSRVVCGHCCALSVRPEADVAQTLGRVSEAGVAIVTLPMCNMYLQDREPGRTPRLRGATLLHEMAARGIRVAAASDNVRDPFYAYGDLDMLEVLREATRIQHLDHPVRSWPAAVTRTPAAIMGHPDRGVIAPGAPANLVLFGARSWTELLARPWSDRTVLRAGVPVAARVPDYRELDELEGMAV